MRDPTHQQSIERWARYIKANPGWKAEHTAFIDAQFDHSAKVAKRLQQHPEGKKKLRRIYGIKNKKDYPSFY
jgi:hypothetical protein